MKAENVLSNWFAIHQEAVEANRQGIFSNVQKELIRLRFNDTNWKQGLLLIAVMLGACIISDTLTSLLLLNDVTSTFSTIAVVIIVAVGSVSWMKARVRNRVDKILNGGIDIGLGKYFFEINKKNYIALCENYPLESLLPISYVPGTYKFYYLKELAILLSAESCPQESVQSYNPETDSLSAVLQNVIGFNMNDLAANRNGELSEQQRSRFKNKLKQKQGTVYFIAGRGSHKPYGEVSTAAAALDLGMNLLGPLPNAIYYLAKTISPTEKHFFFIGDKQITVPGVAWVALLDGLSYKVYFLEGTNELLSIEQISE